MWANGFHKSREMPKMRLLCAFVNGARTREGQTTHRNPSNNGNREK